MAVNRMTVAVAAETAFASVAAGSPVPDASGLSYVGMECERIESIYDGQTSPALDPDMTRAGAGRRKPEPVTVNISGTPQRRRTMDAISITAPLRGLGSASAFASYSVMPLVRCINTMLGLSAAGADTDDVVADTSATAWEPTTAANLAAGRLVQWESNGRVEYTAVTEASSGGGDDLVASPALSGAPQIADTLRLCDVLYPTLDSGSLGASVALRVDMVSHRLYLVGCQARRVVLEPREGLVYATVELVPAYVIDDDASASMADPTIADGSVATFLQSYFVYSDSVTGVAAPHAAARNVADVGTWRFEATASWLAQGGSASNVGISGRDLTDITAELSVEGAQLVSAWRADFTAGVERSIMVGCGRQGAGNGCAIHIPQAHLTADSLPQEAEGIHRQRATWRAGPYAGDSSATAPGQTDFRIGLVR